ncbi:MAG: bile acid:sodium symporter family protein [Planctomycetes bacterium]|nr:bile acid:sodium symporter family protein [Planctomycetota bacterium]
MLQRFLLVWLILSSLAAFYWPAMFPSAPDPFLQTAPYLWLLITVTMFAIGWMLPQDEVQQLRTRWATVLGGTAVQYLTMPLLAYLMGRACGLTGEYLIGVVMVGSVPGAMASNVLTFLARGNTSYSVSLTTSATLLSPLAVPVALGLALRAEQSVDSWVLLKAGVSLLATVVIPVVVGYLMARQFPRGRAAAQRIGSTVANLTILWIIAVVVASNRGRFSQSASEVPLTAMLIALTGLNLAGYLAGYAGGLGMRLPVPMRRALTLEVGMQNAGLGAYLAKELFASGDAIAMAPAMYTFGCMLTGTLLASYWGRVRRGSSPADDQPSLDS